MSSPQLENGYIRIATEIFEALCAIRISGEARQVVDTVLRKTYGFNKKEDWISISQFALSTRITKPNVVRALNKAISMNLIIKKDNKKVILYRFNKDFSTWRPLSKKITTSRVVIKKDNRVLSKKITTIDTLTKDINTPIPSKSVKVKKNMKKNSFKYNENNHSDEFESVVDSESGEERFDPKRKSSTLKYQEIIYWAEERRGSKFLKQSILKQYKAFNIARENNINPSELKRRWEEFESDKKFWAVKGFDWMDVVLSFNKKR